MRSDSDLATGNAVLATINKAFMEIHKGFVRHIEKIPNLCEIYFLCHIK